MTLLKHIFTAAAVLGAASAAVLPRGPLEEPKADGFPSPSDQQLLKIEEKAGGAVPNGPTPTKLGKGSTTALQLITFNELFESYYFNSLLKNITDSVPGYETIGQERDALIRSYSAILAQEELHALVARGILESAKADFIPTPCKYQAPVDNLNDAISLAETFTSVVLGALQGAAVLFAEDGVFPLVQAITSVIGQEGEQNGFYRVALDRVPSEKPFLTHVPAPFAYSALQLFVVPDSCPFPLSKIDLPIFPPLSVNGGPVALLKPENQRLTFSANLTDSKAAEPFVGKSDAKLYITYTTGQQLPISVPVDNVHWSGKSVTVSAHFPFLPNVMQGFNHAALTTSANFTDADSVVDKTLAAPAVLQVNDRL